MLHRALVCLLVTFLQAEGRKQGHVVGGTDGDIANFPWMANIRFFDSQFCSGVLINDVSGQARYILTTALCAGDNADAVTVRMGNTIQFEGTEFEVDNVTRHENFNNYVEDPSADVASAHNIAVLKLKTVASGTNIRAATLASVGANYDNTKCRLAAWGRISPDIGGLYPQTLQVGEYTNINNTDCNTTFSGIFNSDPVEPTFRDIVDEQMCCMDKTNDPPTVSACDQDEGAALNCGAGFDIVAGIVSFQPHALGDVENCVARAPTVYTRIDKYLSWIAANTP